jgi:hypothetical protein
MKKYIIIWDAGFGEEADVVEAISQEEALKEAYERWREDAESNAAYRAELYSDDLAEDYDLDEEEDNQ